MEMYSGITLSVYDSSVDGILFMRLFVELKTYLHENLRSYELRILTSPFPYIQILSNSFWSFEPICKKPVHIFPINQV